MKSNKFGYFIKEGFSSIFTHGFMSFATVCVIMACLLIMGAFSLLAVNIQSLLKNLESQNEVVAFVNESLTEDEAKALQSRVESAENVASATFISRDEAMTSFLQKYENNSLFEDLDSTVLRHRYVVTMVDIGKMAETQSSLAAIDGIEKVNAHLEISRGFVTVRNVVAVISIILIVVLLLVSIFIMANTIKLATLSRREEIAIMKMVGATNSFIRWPFVLEGLILGIMGAAVAYLVTWGVYYLVYAKAVGATTFAFVELVPFGRIALPLLIGYGGIGLVVGVFGSSTAIKNYLKV